MPFSYALLPPSMRERRKKKKEPPVEIGEPKVSKTCFSVFRPGNGGGGGRGGRGARKEEKGGEKDFAILFLVTARSRKRGIISAKKKGEEGKKEEGKKRGGKKSRA